MQCRLLGSHVPAIGGVLLVCSFGAAKNCKPVRDKEGLQEPPRAAEVRFIWKRILRVLARSLAWTHHPDKGGSPERPRPPGLEGSRAARGSST